MLSILVAAYVAVLLAELLGDKSIYTIASLSMRLGASHVLLGASLAFAAKMALAVLIGRSIAQFPRGVVAAMSSIAFFGTAIALWRKRLDDAAPVHDWRRNTTTAFGAVFFSEWIDVGQLTAVALTARFHHPVAIWIAATTAMITKCAVAITLGLGLSKTIRPERLRLIACATCVAMAILSASRIDL